MYKIQFCKKLTQGQTLTFLHLNSGKVTTMSILSDHQQYLSVVYQHLFFLLKYCLKVLPGLFKQNGDEKDGTVIKIRAHLKGDRHISVQYMHPMYLGITPCRHSPDF